MNIPSVRLSRPFLFSLLVVAVLASKFLHLFQHAHTIPPLRFILYFPTFFVQDIVTVIVGRLLLQPGTGALFVAALTLGAFLSFLMLATAAGQLGFYYITGAEMQFDSASNVAGDPAAIGLILSGVVEVMVSAMILIIIAFFCTPWLYNKVGFWLAAVWKLTTPGNWDMLLPTVRTRPDQSHKRVIRIWPFCLLTGVLALITLLCLRPSRPYNHISVTLPVALLRVFHSPTHTENKCALGSSLSSEPFPFPELIAEENWEMPRGHFKGWAPGKSNMLANTYRKRKPEWLLDDTPYGFGRWQRAFPDPTNSTAHAEESIEDKCQSGDAANYYNPVADPLRITNLDMAMYESLEAALSSVLISNVVLITMESHRKDLFPIKEGSNLHKNILESHDEKDRAEINMKLRQLTPVAEQVTGEHFWKNSTGKPDLEFSSDIWRDSVAPGMGGINVVGAVTGSSLSFKSFLGSHCGVFPLPVNFLEEVTTDVYQPCIPQILQLFNNAKKENKTSKAQLEQRVESDPYRADVHSRPWKSVFIQSITDTYDRQGIMNEKMGMQEVIVKETLLNESSKYYPPKSPILNYFGFPDTDVRAPVRDMIMEAAQNKTRLFLSHFTSTTHHPWKVPDFYNKTDYMGSQAHKNMNSFLNTIRYVDLWMGEILGMIDEAGIANETLVVFVGDHGQAFEEDGPMTGTYKNGHISNFRVPIVFRHPHLPRIQIEANATSMAILPTLLDLLIHSKSLNSFDTAVASDIIHDYEGQSLLRPFKSEHKGRYSWNLGIINSGGDMVSVQSAGKPWRVIVPLKQEFSYRFTNLDTDPDETDPIEGWSVSELSHTLKQKWGDEAVDWLVKADGVTRWWKREMHRLYNYDKDE
ncbi:sulfatase [Coccidioides immitis RS]|uniref:Sulfatase n=2 Tax=Coccidioides immitis TaxID=5501 RepID=J3K4K6_COCIM|nr:sulfatase [Coccidioides immitis RS]EAS29257.3 sulfatase [Coccidioides immitis RS]KMP06388.1 sulfatase domain containing protein [Coccidioides immitis RMSCC 2394]TPX22629.1 hypothetical protein DIZ76_014507 [Coccidioides immitis]